MVASRDQYQLGPDPETWMIQNGAETPEFYHPRLHFPSFTRDLQTLCGVDLKPSFQYFEDVAGHPRGNPGPAHLVLLKEFGGRHIFTSPPHGGAQFFAGLVVRPARKSGTWKRIGFWRGYIVTLSRDSVSDVQNLGGNNVEEAAKGHESEKCTENESSHEHTFGAGDASMFLRIPGARVEEITLV